LPEQGLADIILPLSAETQVISRYLCTVPPSAAWQSCLYCRRVIKEESGGNRYVQNVRHTHPKMVQVFAQAKQLSSCLTQAWVK